MSGFIYRSRPAQLVYVDGGNVIPLPCWVSVANDLSYVEAGIRSRRWGNIPFDSFYLRVWTNYANADPDDEYAYVEVNVFTTSTGYPPTTPAWKLLRNNVLT